MSRGERGVRAKDGADLEDLAEAGGHRHLLVELRRLRQVGLGLEVLNLEQLRARLARRAHELGRVDLDEALFAPEVAHRVLRRGLHLEDQLPVGAAQVQVAPIDPLVQGGVRRDRHLRLSERIDLEALELELETAQLYALIRCHRTRDRHRRLRRQGRDRLVELTRRVLLGKHHLRKAGFVADDHELHPLLVAHRVHPAADSHLLADPAGQLLDQCSAHALTLSERPLPGLLGGGVF